MRFQWLAALTVALVGVGAAQAQPEKQSEPTVELRLRSVNDLLDKAEFVSALAGKDDVIKIARGFLKSITKEKTGLAGIDPKRPFGFYANLSVDVVNSPSIVMIPIADQETFLKFIADKGITTEKGEEGTIKVFVPVVSELYMRFTNDYLYIGRSVKDVDPKVLIAPKAFFAKDDGAFASLIFRLDTIPDDLKAFILGQFELVVAEQRKMNGEKEDPTPKVLLDFFADGVTGALKTLFDDGKEFKVRLFVEEKGDDLSAEVSLTAKKGSTLAKTFTSVSGQTSIPAAITAAKDPVVRASAKAALTPDLKKRFSKVVDELSKEIEDKADPNAKAVVRQALETLGPTFKAAELDAAFALDGPDAKGKHKLILALAVKKGKDIEKLLKELSQSAGAVADFDFDVEKIGEFSLHKIALNAGPPELEKIFGTRTFWLAVSDSYLALSIEPEGSLIREGLKAKATTVPAFSFELSAAKLLPLVGKDLKPDELKAIMKDAFGDGATAGKDTISVTITGGEVLTLKAKVKGKAVRVFSALGEMKK